MRYGDELSLQKRVAVPGLKQLLEHKDRDLV